MTDNQEFFETKDGRIIIHQGNIDLEKIAMLHTNRIKEAEEYCIIPLKQFEQLTITQQKLDRAVEALEFYADDKNYNDGIIGYYIENFGWECEFGDKAKAALASISPLGKILEEDTKDQQKRNDFYKDNAGELLGMIKEVSIKEQL